MNQIYYKLKWNCRNNKQQIILFTSFTYSFIPLLKNDMLTRIARTLLTTENCDKNTYTSCLRPRAFQPGLLGNLLKRFYL